MKFMRNVWIAAKKTPTKTWVIALVTPGGLVAVTAWISAKSLYRVLKRKHDKSKISR